jgi:hypothetical protein
VLRQFFLFWWDYVVCWKSHNFTYWLSDSISSPHLCTQLNRAQCS